MILLCGDPHGEFDHIIQRVQQSRPAAVIILGDLSLSLPFEQTFAAIWDMTQLWYIHGNHDTDQVRYYDNLFSCPERNLHGRVVEIDGLKVAGLGGFFGARSGIRQRHRSTTPERTSWPTVARATCGGMGCHESIAVPSFLKTFRACKACRQTFW